MQEDSARGAVVVVRAIDAAGAIRLVAEGFLTDPSSVLIPRAVQELAGGEPFDLVVNSGGQEWETLVPHSVDVVQSRAIESGDAGFTVVGLATAAQIQSSARRLVDPVGLVLTAQQTGSFGAGLAAVGLVPNEFPTIPVDTLPAVILNVPPQRRIVLTEGDDETCIRICKILRCCLVPGSHGPGGQEALTGPEALVAEPWEPSLEELRVALDRAEDDQL